MLSKYQKQKLLYSLLIKSNSFLNLKNVCIEISKMTYDFNISNVTEEEREFLKDNSSLQYINKLDSVDIYKIVNNDSYSKFEISNQLFYRDSIINSEYTLLDKGLKDDEEVIEDIKHICNYKIIPIYKFLNLDKNIIIPDLADQMNDVDYLLECEKQGKFDFSRWISLLKSYKSIKDNLKEKLFLLQKFLSLEFLNITELKSISPELYQILKSKDL